MIIVESILVPRVIFKSRQIDGDDIIIACTRLSLSLYLFLIQCNQIGLLFKEIGYV